MNARRHDNGVTAPTNAKELAPMTDAVQLPPDKIKGAARPIGEIIRPIVDRIESKYRAGQFDDRA